MRIMLWSESFAPYIGGVQRSADLLLPELKRRGFEIVIVTSHHYMTLPDEELWEGIPLYRFDFSTALARSDLALWVRQQKRLATLVDSFRPALHHIFSIGPSMVACLQLRKQRKAPLVASLVSMEQQPTVAYAPEGVIAKTLTSATWITAVSQAIVDHTVKYLPEVRSRISVLRYGYPSPTLAPTPLAYPARILLLGRVVAGKGGELAIAAFERLYQRYPDARLIIAGDGAEREAWQRLASPMGDRVEFLGWVAPGEVYALLNRATMTLIPSAHEGLPLVSIETAYMARPTIATRIPGMSEIVIDGETGLLFEPGDVEGLARAIAHLLDNPDQATAMGLAARKRVDAHFSLRCYVEEHESLYRKVLEMV